MEVSQAGTDEGLKLRGVTESEKSLRRQRTWEKVLVGPAQPQRELGAGDRKPVVLTVRQGWFESESILMTAPFSAEEVVEQGLEGAPGMTRGVSHA